MKKASDLIPSLSFEVVCRCDTEQIKQRLCDLDDLLPDYRAVKHEKIRWRFFPRYPGENGENTKLKPDMILSWTITQQGTKVDGSIMCTSHIYSLIIARIFVALMELCVVTGIVLSIADQQYAGLWLLVPIALFVPFIPRIVIADAKGRMRANAERLKNAVIHVLKDE